MGDRKRSDHASARVSAGLLLLLTLTGCGSSIVRVARMSVPDALAGASVHPATEVTRASFTGRMERAFVLGPWSVARLDRSLTRTSAAESGPARAGLAALEYSFDLEREGEVVARIECRASGAQGALRYERDDESFSSSFSSTELVCTDVMTEPSAPATLRLEVAFDGLGTGAIRTATETLALEASNRIEGSRFASPEATGWLVYAADSPVAAVDTLNDGRVITTREDDTLIGLFAAILLFDDPVDALER